MASHASTPAYRNPETTQQDSESWSTNRPGIMAPHVLTPAYRNPGTTQQGPESWLTNRLGPFVSDTRMQDAMHCFQSFNRQRTNWSRTEEKVFYITEFSRSGRGQSRRLLRIDLNKHFRLELFVGHVTEPKLANILKVSIASLWLFTSHLLPGVTS